jgi:hypothetical protein
MLKQSLSGQSTEYDRRKYPSVPSQAEQEMSTRMTAMEEQLKVSLSSMAFLEFESESKISTKSESESKTFDQV